MMSEVTKEHSSAASLKKPFRTPFKVHRKDGPQNITPEERQPSPVIELSSDEIVVDENIQESRKEHIIDEDLPGIYSRQLLISLSFIPRLINQCSYSY